jgi:hypothetical protein
MVVVALLNTVTSIHQYIVATGALHGAGSLTLLFFDTFPLGLDLDGPASTSRGIDSSSTSCAGVLRFRPRFPLPFSLATVSLAARSARTLWRSSHRITLPSPFPSLRTKERVVRRTVASLLMLHSRRLWSWRRLCLATDILAALTSFCTRLSRRCLLASSGAPASRLIRSCNTVKPSAVTGVTGVAGVSGTSLWEEDPTSLATEMTRSAGGFGVLRSTLSGLKGIKPVAAHPAMMFLLVSAFSLAGAYR